jgi:predicted RNA-binding protein with RPS1 domain
MSNDPQETPPPEASTEQPASQPASNEAPAAEPGSIPAADNSSAAVVSAALPSLTDVAAPMETPAPEAADAEPQSSPSVPPASDVPQPASVQRDSVNPVPDAEPKAEPAVVAEEIVSSDGRPHPSASPSDQSVAQRIRKKMATTAVRAADDAGDGTAQKPDTPKSDGHIEIPATDDLDADLEAEISAAMGTPEAVPQPVAVSEEVTPDPAEESDSEAGDVVAGTKVEGTILQINGDDVFLDAGLRHNIVVSLRQFPNDKPPTVGDKAGVVVEEIDSDGLIRGRLPRGRHRVGGNWDALAEGQVVDCMVSATNKGGLQVMVSNLRAFLPASQIEIGYSGDLEKYVGQKLTVQITEVNKKKRNLVVSRRVLLQAERAEGEAQFWQAVGVDQTFTGVVKTLKDYGAFINIGPVDGFLHIGEISWSRINHPSDVLQEGQSVEVKVLKLDPDKKRISLGMKQLEVNPWTHAADKYSSGRTVGGTVTRIADFGAFVELEPGLEGLVHISQLAWRRVGSVSEILSVGESREFQVQEIDLKRKRVSLSLKALEQRPEPAKPAAGESDDAPAPPRQRNPNLRGGRDGGDKGGSLFGNPNDFS